MKLGETAAKAGILVGGDRNDAYGDPIDEYERTVRLFRILTGHNLTAAEGVTFMQCVKLSRESFLHKTDNLIDLAGYADVLNYIEEKLGRETGE